MHLNAHRRPRHLPEPPRPFPCEAAPSKSLAGARHTCQRTANCMPGLCGAPPCAALVGHAIGSLLRESNGLCLPRSAAGIEAVDLPRLRDLVRRMESAGEPATLCAPVLRLWLLCARLGDSTSIARVAEAMDGVRCQDDSRWRTLPTTMVRFAVRSWLAMVESGIVSVHPRARPFERTMADVAADIDDNRTEEPTVCSICMGEPPRVVFEPCGHMCLCLSDWAEMTARQSSYEDLVCPLCRSVIEAAWPSRSMILQVACESPATAHEPAQLRLSPSPHIHTLSTDNNFLLSASPDGMVTTPDEYHVTTVGLAGLSNSSDVVDLPLRDTLHDSLMPAWQTVSQRLRREHEGRVPVIFPTLPSNIEQAAGRITGPPYPYRNAILGLNATPLRSFSLSSVARSYTIIGDDDRPDASPMSATVRPAFDTNPTYSRRPASHAAASAADMLHSRVDVLDSVQSEEDFEPLSHMQHAPRATVAPRTDPSWSWLTDEIHTPHFDSLVARQLAHGRAQEPARRRAAEMQSACPPSRFYPDGMCPLFLPAYHRPWMEDHRGELYDAMRACADATTTAKSDSLVCLLAHAVRGLWTRVPHRPRGPLRRTMSRIQTAAEEQAARNGVTAAAPLDFIPEADIARTISVGDCDRAAALLALYETDGDVPDAVQMVVEHAHASAALLSRQNSGQAWMSTREHWRT
ncbi:Zinc-finger domain containing protein [Pandoravirus salinus]|uniref:Zinc-finger domain containing protein n=1 Tax=Pandoravirus salinus TaxID=1349410 RepID=S4W5T6_9VIRU|nr:Zinc-finger domain [Pandoravirus salinus]AGO85755.2 Zinc-finger domain containing protein [Pandoravirus salinus]